MEMAGGSDAGALVHERQAENDPEEEEEEREASVATRSRV